MRSGRSKDIFIKNKTRPCNVVAMTTTVWSYLFNKAHTKITRVSKSRSMLSTASTVSGFSPGLYYRNSYGTWFKTAAAVLTGLFLLNNISWAAPKDIIPKNTLATEKIFKALKYKERERSAKIKFEIITGIRLLGAGKDDADGKSTEAVNGFLTESYRNTGEQRRVEFLGGIRRNAGSIEARIKIVGRGNAIFKVLYQNAPAGSTAGALKAEDTQLAKAGAAGGILYTDVFKPGDCIRIAKEKPQAKAAGAVNFDLIHTENGTAVQKPEGLQDDGTHREVGSFVFHMLENSYGLSDWGTQVKQVVLVDEDGVFGFQEGVLTISRNYIGSGGDRDAIEDKLKKLLLAVSPQAQKIRKLIINQMEPALTESQSESLALTFPYLGHHWRHAGVRSETEAINMLLEEVSDMPDYLTSHRDALKEVAGQLGSERFYNIIASVHGYFSLRVKMSQQFSSYRETGSFHAVQELKQYKRRFFQFIEKIEQDTESLYKWRQFLSAIREQARIRKGDDILDDGEAFIEFIFEYVHKAMENLPKSEQTPSTYERIARTFVEIYRELPHEIRKSYLGSVDEVFKRFEGDERPFWDILNLVKQIMILRYNRNEDLKELGWRNYHLDSYPDLESYLSILRVKYLLLKYGVSFWHNLEAYHNSQTSGRESLRVLPSFVKNRDGEWEISTANSEEKNRLDNFISWLQHVSGRAVSYKPIDPGAGWAELVLGNKFIRPERVKPFDNSGIRKKAASGFIQSGNRKSAKTPSTEKPEDGLYSIGILSKARLFHEAQKRRHPSTEGWRLREKEIRDLLYFGKLYDGRVSAQFFSQAETEIEKEHRQYRPREAGDYDSTYIQNLLYLGENMLKEDLVDDGERLLNKAFLYMEGLVYHSAGKRKDDNLRARNGKLLNYILEIARCLTVNGRENEGLNYFNFVIGFDHDQALVKYDQLPIKGIVTSLWKKYEQSGDKRYLELLKNVIYLWERNIDLDLKTSLPTLELLEAYQHIAAGLSTDESEFADYLNQTVDDIYRRLWERELITLDRATSFDRIQYNLSKKDENLLRALGYYLRNKNRGDTVTIDGAKYSIHDQRSYMVKDVVETESGLRVTYTIYADEARTVDYTLDVPRADVERLKPPLFDKGRTADYLDFFWEQWRHDNAFYQGQNTPFREERFEKENILEGSLVKVVLERIIRHRPRLFGHVLQSLKEDIWPCYKKLELFNWIFDHMGDRLDDGARQEIFNLWQTTVDEVSEAQLREYLFDRISESHDSRWNELSGDLMAVYLEEIRKLNAARVRFGVKPVEAAASAAKWLERFDESYRKYNERRGQIGIDGGMRSIPAQMQVTDTMVRDERKRSEAGRRLLEEIIEDVPEGMRDLVRMQLMEETEKREKIETVLLDPRYIKLKYLVDLLNSLSKREVPGGVPADLKEELLSLAGDAARTLPDKFDGAFDKEIYQVYPKERSSDNDREKLRVLLDCVQYGYQALEETVEYLIDAGELHDAERLLSLLEGVREGFRRLEAKIEKDIDRGGDASSSANALRLMRISRMKDVYSRAFLILNTKIAQRYLTGGDELKARELIRVLMQAVRNNPEDFSDQYKIYFAMELSKAEDLGEEKLSWFRYVIGNVKLIHRELRSQARTINNVANLSEAIHAARGISDKLKEDLLARLFGRIKSELAPSATEPTQEDKAQFFAMQALSLIRLYEIVHESDRYPRLRSSVLEHFYGKLSDIYYEETLSSWQGMLMFEAIKKLAEVIGRTNPGLTQEETVSRFLDAFPDNKEAQDHLAVLFPEATGDYIGDVDLVRFFERYNGRPKEKAILRYFASSLSSAGAIDRRLLRSAMMKRVKKDLQKGIAPDESFAHLLQAFILHENQKESAELFEKFTRQPSRADVQGKAPVTSFLYKRFLKLASQGKQENIRRAILEILLHTKTAEEAGKGTPIYCGLFVQPNLSDDERELIFLKILESRNEFDSGFSEYLKSYYLREIQYYKWVGYSDKLSGEERSRLESKAMRLRRLFLADMVRFMNIKNGFREFLTQIFPVMPREYYKQGRSTLKYMKEMDEAIAVYLRYRGNLQNLFFRNLEEALEEKRKELESQNKIDKGRMSGADTSGSERYRFERNAFNPGKTYLYSLLDNESYVFRLFRDEVKEGKFDSDPRMTGELKREYGYWDAVDIQLLKDLQSLDGYLRRVPEPYISDPRSPYHLVFRMRFAKLSAARRRKILDDFRSESTSDIFSIEEVMRRVIIQNGTGDIKFGQVLSTRDDLIEDPTYRAELAKLKDSVPPIPYEKERRQSRGYGREESEEPSYSIYEALKAAFPARKQVVRYAVDGSGIRKRGDGTLIWEDPKVGELRREEGDSVVFYRFWKEPIAVASIGQVHRAVIWDGERFVDVIVKILKPNAPGEVEEGRLAWLEITEFVEQNPERFPDVKNPGHHVRTIFDEIAKELNFSLEKHNMQEMAAVLADEKAVSVPHVYEAHSNGTVLTMSRAQGAPINKTPERFRKKTARTFMGTMLYHIFKKGTYHADPHDKNIFAAFVDENLLMTFLDLGMIGHLAEEERKKLVELIFRAYQKNIAKIIEALRAMGDFPEEADTEAFSARLEEIVTDEDKGSVPRDKFIEKLDATGLTEEAGELLLFFGDLEVPLTSIARLEGDRLLFKPGITEKDISRLSFPEELKERAKILKDIFRDAQKPVSKQIQKIFEAAAKNGLSIDAKYTILIKALVTAEGVTRDLDSNYDSAVDLGPVILPYVWETATWDEKMQLTVSIYQQYGSDDGFMQRMLPEVWKVCNLEEKTKILIMLLGKVSQDMVSSALPGGEGVSEMISGMRESALNSESQGLLGGLLQVFSGGAKAVGGLASASADRGASEAVREQAERISTVSRMRAKLMELLPEIFPQLWESTSGEDRAGLIRTILRDSSFSMGELKKCLALVLENAGNEDLKNLFFALLSDDDLALLLFGYLRDGLLSQDQLKEYLLILLDGYTADESRRLRELLGQDEVRQILFDLILKIWPGLNINEKRRLIGVAAELFNSKGTARFLHSIVDEIWKHLSDEEKVQMAAASFGLFWRYSHLRIPLVVQALKQTAWAEKWSLIVRLFANGIKRIFRSEKSQETLPAGPAVAGEPSGEASITEVRPDRDTVQIPRSRGTGYFDLSYPTAPSREISSGRRAEIESLLDARIETIADVELVCDILRDISPLGRFLLQQFDERNIPLTLDIMPGSNSNLTDILLDRNNKRTLWIGFLPGVSFKEALYHLIHELVHSLPLAEGISYPRLTPESVRNSSVDELTELILNIFAFEEALAFSSDIELYDEAIHLFGAEEEAAEQIEWQYVWSTGFQGDSFKFSPAVVRLWKETMRNEGFDGFVARIRQYYPPFNPREFGNYIGMARDMANIIKQNQGDFGNLEDPEWERKSRLARKLTAINRFSGVQALLHAMQRGSSEEMIDKDTLKRLSRSDELENFVSELVDDLGPEDVPELVKIVPVNGLLPPELSGLAGMFDQVIGSKQVKDGLAQLAPLNQPEIKDAAKNLLVSEVRKWLNANAGAVSAESPGARTRPAGAIQAAGQREVSGEKTEEAAPEAIHGQEERRLSQVHRYEKSLLVKSCKFLKGYPVNMTVDLSVIPGEKDGLTEQQARMQLEENMETLARLVAWHSMFGLDIRYILEHETDKNYEQMAKEILKNKLTGLAEIPGMDSGNLLARIGIPHSDLKTIEIQLKGLDAIKKLETIGDRTYPIALGEDKTKSGISIPNYTAASSIGLSLAALRVAKEENPEEYTEKRNRMLKKFRGVYECYGINAKGFTKDVLDMMVTGSSKTRLDYVIKYALPPVVKMAVEKLNDYHQKMQRFLQSA